LGLITGHRRRGSNRVHTGVNVPSEGGPGQGGHCDGCGAQAHSPALAVQAAAGELIRIHTVPKAGPEQAVGLDLL
jgi:hypothetical protein